MSWISTDKRMDGISVPILEGGDGKRPNWKRSDGFGRMTDSNVLAYKEARPKRYPEVIFAPIRKVL